MSIESFNRTSEIIETPSYISKTPKRVDVGVLKQRLLEEKKKRKSEKNYNFIFSCSLFGCSDVINLLKFLNLSL